MEVHKKEFSNILTEIQNSTIKELNRLYLPFINNEGRSLNNVINLQQIQSQTDEFNLKLLKTIEKEKPIECCMPQTDCIVASALLELEKEVENMGSSLTRMKGELAAITKECHEYENRRDRLKGVQSIQLETKEKGNQLINQLAFRQIKRLFKETKKDLFDLVEMLYPDNQGFKDFLGALTMASSKGGDDTYIHITPQTCPFVSILLEAGLIIHHRNDKNKVRMTDLV